MKIFIFLIFSFNIYAQSDLESIVNFVDQNETEISSNDQQQDRKQKKIELPKSLQFIYGFKDLDNFDLKTISFKNDQELAKMIQDNPSYDYVFDQAYQEIQEYCFIEDLSDENLAKCEALQEKMMEIVYYFEEDQTSGGKVEDLFGISLDGKNFTLNEISIDSNQEYYNGYIDNDRYGPGLKGKVNVGNNNIDINQLDLDSVICEYKKLVEIEADISSELVQLLIDQMEEALLDYSVSIEDRNEIFCLLNSYYHSNEMYDEIIEFLYLNMPDPNNMADCSE